MNVSGFSAAELQQLIADSTAQLNKKICDEGLLNFTHDSKRSEVRDFLISQYGRSQNKTLLDDSIKRGGNIIGLKCKHCSTFKLNCVNLKKQGGWHFVAGDCTLFHDALCIGSYTPSTVSLNLKLYVKKLILTLIGIFSEMLQVTLLMRS
jgi:hypothetical protein